MKLTRIIIAALAVVMLGSCNIYKKYETPTDSALTKAYAEARKAEVDSAAFGNMVWEDIFTDPMLADLINQALTNNTNLRNAKLNIDMARAQVLGAKLSYLPAVALSPNGAGSSYAGSKLGWTYTLPAQASWEIDIFGKLLNSKRGAQVALQQSEDYYQAVRSQIVAAVASTYYTIAMYQSQLDLSRETAQLWSQSVQTMRDLKLAGRTNEASVVQSEANYYSILASITDIEVKLHEMNNTMSLLLNVMPQTFAIPGTATLTVPAIYREGVPMRELAARPDVRAAEMNLAAAYYTTNAARAAFYPGLSISFQGGFSNIVGTAVINLGEWFYQLAGSLVAPLFSRGQNIAKLKAAKAQQQQALNSFEYTLMSAASEVSEAMVVYQKNVEKSKFLALQVDDMTKALSYTTDLLNYYNGTYLEVLTAQQGLLSAQMNEIACRQMQALAVISLYQSLGGGR